MYAEKKKDLVALALERIQGDYALLEGVEGLAAELGVTKCHLIRRMQAAVGESPGKLLRRRRLEMAAALLRGRAYPVEAVARMTGFSCGNYFSKVFARAYGQSPRDYRLALGGPLPEALEKQVQALEYLYQA